MTATRYCLAALALVGGLSGGPAAGQGTAAPTTSQSRDHAVIRLCRAEVTAFCPALGQATTASGRNIAICLKPYGSSLSFGCRRAVKSVFP